MRHRKKNAILDRKKDARTALIKSQVASLIKYGKIKTTTAKAKNLKKFIEKLITFQKKNNLAAQREIIKFVNNRAIAQKLIKSVKFNDKKSGHVKLSKIGFRKGDGAEITQIELI